MNIQADSLVGRLTIAQQQMVEIVKAISYHSKILVMDEPTSSISDKEVGFLFNTIRNLTQQGSPIRLRRQLKIRRPINPQHRLKIVDIG